MSPLHAIVSIHDVAPETLEQVAGLIEGLPDAAKRELILLVIPGLKWQPAQIDQLRAWQQRGFTLAGHGWLHHTDKISGFYHKCHSLFISRKVAEHLSLNSEQIIELMNRNYQWFIDQGLQAPDCYVPPAWALGRVSLKQLQQTPYRFIETTAGYLDIGGQQRKRLPLIGFEADTTFRKYTLLAWNKINTVLSSENKPLRISIHPRDGQLKLAASLARYTLQVSRVYSYRRLFSS